MSDTNKLSLKTIFMGVSSLPALVGGAYLYDNTMGNMPVIGMAVCVLAAALFMGGVFGLVKDFPEIPDDYTDDLSPYNDVLPDDEKPPKFVERRNPARDYPDPQ